VCWSRSHASVASKNGTCIGDWHSSGLPSQEAPVNIAEKLKFPFFCVGMAHALESGTWLAGRPADSFAVRNRMSLPGSLHRISAMKGDQGDIQGLTYRVGRHISGQHFPFAWHTIETMLPMFVTIRIAPADK